MDFKLNETQTMIQDGVRRLLETSVNSENIRTTEASANGFDTELWSQMAELGWAGLAIPESAGGGGMGAVELCVVAEELGRAAATTPLVLTAGFSATLLQKVSQNDTTKEFLSMLASSDSIITPALTETGGRDERSVPTSLLTETADGGTISGTKILVPFASVAKILLVSVVTSDGEQAIVAVDADADGISCNRHRVTGGSPSFQVEFADVAISADRVLARGNDVVNALDLALDAAALLASAEVVGNCEGIIALSTDYTATREQFGQKIGSFQAVAHPQADMRVNTDACRLLVSENAWLLDTQEQATLEIAETKVFANEVVVEMVHAAHAVHGAIGYTMEYDLQLYTRRARCFCLQYGDTALQTERAAVALGL